MERREKEAAKLTALKKKTHDKTKTWDSTIAVSQIKKEKCKKKWFRLEGDPECTLRNTGNKISRRSLFVSQGIIHNVSRKSKDLQAAIREVLAKFISFEL